MCSSPDSLDNKDMDWEPKHDVLADRKIATCGICLKKYQKYKTLKKHILSHDNYLQCMKCGNGFNKILDYVTHCKQHSDDKYFCCFCKYDTMDQATMDSHLKEKHLNNYKYVCKICKIGFHFLSRYKKHLSSHPTNKSFVCPICKKQYSAKTNLNRHINRHSTEGAMCDVCGLRLGSNYILKLHMRIHTGEKPYKCSHCEKCFAKLGTLKDHEKTHTGAKPHKCTECGKCFAQKTTLAIHMKGHKGEKSFVCSICQKSFVYKSFLNFHIKKCKGPKALK